MPSMEFWDVLEDSQYLDAVASVRDGPRPLCKWEIPTSEQLSEWEGRVRTEKTPTTERQSSENKEDHDSVVPLTLDWYASCPIGFFFFSAFVKDQHYRALTNSSGQEPHPQSTNGNTRVSSHHPSPPDRNTNTQIDKLAYVRMNFLEDLIRFQKILKSISPVSRPKEAQQRGEILMEYVQAPMEQEEIEDCVLPEMTQIEESDLFMPRCSSNRRLGFQTQTEMEAFLTMNYDNDVALAAETNNRNNLVGLKGPLAKEFTQALQEWIDAKANLRKSGSEPVLHRKEKEDTGGVPIMEEKALVSDETKTSMSTNPTKPNLRHSKTDLEGNLTHGYHHNSTTDDVTLIASNLLAASQKVEILIYESLKRDYGAKFQGGSSQYMRMKNFLWYQDRRVVYEDFYVMRVLGRGGFGLVSACQKGTTGKLYAMKVMSKKRIKMKRSVQFVMNERKALAAVSESPFIVNLKYSFQSVDEIYLVLDLMAGGDLGFHLNQMRRFSHNQCLYYAARIMLGLQALHDKDYVYRDLKPENCLLSEDGRVKLTDLGLATKTTPHLPSGVVGTRGYWAPEMQKRDVAGKRVPYNHIVDWFSFGCCLAEFICGHHPFRCDAAVRYGAERGEVAKDKAIDLAIREMEPDFKPELFTPDAADICRRLLDKDPTSRLGAKGGCAEIKAHPWFKSVNWEMVQTDRKRPPFIPPKDINAASQHEIGNFADDSKKEKDKNFDEIDVYKNWDWVNPKAYATEVIDFLVRERELGKPLLPETFGPDLCCCNLL